MTLLWTTVLLLLLVLIGRPLLRGVYLALLELEDRGENVKARMLVFNIAYNLYIFSITAYVMLAAYQIYEYLAPKLLQ